MPKYVFKGLLSITFVVFLAGCATGNNGNGYKVKGYTERRERPDFDVTGNAGYLQGSPSAEEVNRERERTRKFYVVEMTAPPPEGEVIETTVESSQRRVTVEKESYRSPDRSASTSTRREYQTERSIAKATTYLDYTVLENDTLQKISKKFYDSYSKWMRIYDANKDIIDDPNFIKPGLTIRIPQE